MRRQLTIRFVRSMELAEQPTITVYRPGSHPAMCATGKQLSCIFTLKYQHCHLHSRVLPLVK